MTRVLAICAIAASAAMPSGSHAATTVMQSRNFFLGWNDGPNYVFIMANAYVDVVTGNVVAGNAFVAMSTMLGSHSGQMQAQDFTLKLDPLALTGSISGTAQDQSGTIAFSLDFVGTSVTTDVPFARGEVVRRFHREPSWSRSSSGTDAAPGRPRHPWSARLPLRTARPTRAATP